MGVAPPNTPQHECLPTARPHPVRAWLRACRKQPQIDLAVNMLEGRTPAMVVRTETLQDDWRKVGAALGLADATLGAPHCLANCGEKTRGGATPSAARVSCLAAV